MTEWELQGANFKMFGFYEYRNVLEQYPGTNMLPGGRDLVGSAVKCYENERPTQVRKFCNPKDEVRHSAVGL
jgi:hypothetical protein